ncbi:hypothetical protein K438DRAFT_1787028 [Mycena galopus ATCC 62051]|nr:hypothetical protein K438DRAFT_1787028 [Mycena galopus ATCC 62051]
MYSGAVDVEVGDKSDRPPRGGQHALSHDECPKAGFKFPEIAPICEAFRAQNGRFYSVVRSIQPTLGMAGRLGRGRQRLGSRTGYFLRYHTGNCRGPNFGASDVNRNAILNQSRIVAIGGPIGKPADTFELSLRVYFPVSLGRRLALTSSHWATHETWPDDGGWRPGITGPK